MEQGKISGVIDVIVSMKLNQNINNEKQITTRATSVFPQ